jgi:hypothetical protein
MYLCDRILYNSSARLDNEEGIPANIRKNNVNPGMNPGAVFSVQNKPIITRPMNLGAFCNSEF